METAMTLRAIGRVHSPFKQKFGIPRQSGLAPSVQTTIVLDQDLVHPESLDGLEEFSHLWLTFLFHANNNELHKAKIRPPRLKGEKRGFLATRSPHRINPLGLSLVSIKQVNKNKGLIEVTGADLLDQTPIIDIKPYVPRYDHVQAKVPRWIMENEKSKDIQWQEQAKEKLLAQPKLVQTINELLSLDPRNTEDKQKGDAHKVHKIQFGDHDIWFTVLKDCIQVCDIKEL